MALLSMYIIYYPFLSHEPTCLFLSGNISKTILNFLMRKAVSWLFLAPVSSSVYTSKVFLKWLYGGWYSQPQALNIIPFYHLLTVIISEIWNTKNILSHWATSERAWNHTHGGLGQLQAWMKITWSRSVRTLLNFASFPERFQIQHGQGWNPILDFASSFSRHLRPGGLSSVTNGQASPSLTELTIEEEIIALGDIHSSWFWTNTKESLVPWAWGKAMWCSKRSQTSTSTQVNQDPLKKCQS